MPRPLNLAVRALVPQVVEVRYIPLKPRVTRRPSPRRTTRGLRVLVCVRRPTRVIRAFLALRAPAPAAVEGGRGPAELRASTTEARGGAGTGVGTVGAFLL